MQQSHSFTVTAQGGLLRVLKTRCGVWQGFDPANGGVPPVPVEFEAIWDTGATASVITQRVVDACGLQPIGMVEVHGVHGTRPAEVYLVNIGLPNRVAFQDIRVTKGDLGAGDCDLLIGMDIISCGDFSVTNKDGVTIFSFRVPSLASTDFVLEHKRKVAQNHGGGGKPRPAKHKTFGKNKKK
jgi:hypothetical protein